MAKCLNIQGGELDVGGFGTPEINTNICDFSFKIPFSFKLKIPSIAFKFPSIPFPDLSLSISCDFSKPISLDGHLDFGGGRIPCFDPDPDKEEQAA